MLKNDEDGICEGLVKILEDEKQIAKWKEQAKASKEVFYKSERVKQANSILKAGMDNA